MSSCILVGGHVVEYVQHDHIWSVMKKERVSMLILPKLNSIKWKICHKESLHLISGLFQTLLTEHHSVYE